VDHRRIGDVRGHEIWKSSDLAAVALHLAQAFGLVLDPSARAATSLAPLVSMTGVRGAVLVLILVAIAAAGAHLVNQPLSDSR